MKFAAVDVGTNSTRLLIVEYENGNYQVLERDLVITRLGEGVDENNLLKKEAIKRTVNALEKYDKKINDYEVKSTKVVGTSALRDVKNKENFTRLLQKNTKLNLQVISGTEEAQYIYRGVKTDLCNKDFLIIDIGGGSTEFIWEKENKVIEKSLDIGAVRLTERVINNSKKPLSKKEYNILKKEINNILVNENIDKLKTKKLIGVGGTITTLAAMNLKLKMYSSEKIHKHVLTKDKADKIFGKLAKRNFYKRKEIAGLNEKRADIITAGAAILKFIMEIINIGEIQISERDILFGLINEAIEESE